MHLSGTARERMLVACTKQLAALWLPDNVRCCLTFPLSCVELQTTVEMALFATLVAIVRCPLLPGNHAVDQVRQHCVDATLWCVASSDVRSLANLVVPGSAIAIADSTS
jgi:hypothetical protein